MTNSTKLGTTAQSKKAKPKNRGMGFGYAIISLVAVVGFASFTVDLGRTTVAKTELRRAADAAARAGANALNVSPTQAYADARAWSKRNKVEGRQLIDPAIKVEIGVWNTNTRTFKNTVGTGETANACRVVLERSKAAGNALPPGFTQLIGRDGIDIHAEAIAMFVPGVNVNHQVDGFVNPFLSGATKGTVASRNNPHNSPDYAGDSDSTDPAKRKQSGPKVGMPIMGGAALQFDNISGTVRHDPNLDYYAPDGQLNAIGHNINTTDWNQVYNKQNYTNENGLSDMTAPINALVGVFLDDNAPNGTPAPANLDFSTEESRDFTTLKPKLKQIFFIGDGVNSNGTKQDFIAPEGSTRLFLATWDFFEWNNNAGFRMVKVNRPGRVVTVK
ncbi:MAG TPA: pilus assembly protein TadG-related protein [Tepidisphaeraceae bacterium]|nr:pilus assembly protein TadG-related protein [Tepidisphaeraceae bacterium]